MKLQPGIDEGPSPHLYFEVGREVDLDLGSVGVVGSEWSGARVVAEVGVSEWAGPDEHPGVDHAIAPAALGLEAVVSSAQRGEVAGKLLM